LALPVGAELDFRYDQKWIVPAVKDKLPNKVPDNSDCLIIYIDQSDKAKKPEFIPCRFAKLKSANKHGTTATLSMIMKEFGYAENLAGFNEEIMAACGNQLPAWQKDGSISGAYWLEVNDVLQNVIRTSDIGNWERLISQLSEYNDFEDEHVFYMIKELRELGNNKVIEMFDGSYSIESGKSYEMAIYHYHTKSEPSTRYINLSATEGLTLNNPTLVVDSRYDLKRILISSESTYNHARAILSVYIGKEPNSLERKEFDLPYRIRGSWKKIVGSTLLIGILLAIPQIIAVNSNPQIQNPNHIALIISILGISAGYAIVRGLKSPL